MKLRILYPILFVSLFISCSRKYIKQKEDFSHYSLIGNAENIKLKKVVDEYKSKVDSATEKTIAISSEALMRENAQSTLGNFVCDALKYSAEKELKNSAIDLILLNRGGLRINLPKGEIKVSTIFELMPFDNELVLVTITGKKLNEGLATLLGKNHFYLGMKIKVDGVNDVKATISGNKIDTLLTYNIITSDFLANGGDRFTFLQNPLLLTQTHIKVRDAIIDYCNFLTHSGKQIIPYTDDRLEISK